MSTVIYVFATPEAPGLDAQVTACMKVCRALGWDVVKTVRERDPARPKLSALADAVDGGGFERIVFFDWCAMASSNNGDDLHPLVHRIHRAGVDIKLATA